MKRARIAVVLLAALALVSAAPTAVGAASYDAMVTGSGRFEFASWGGSAQIVMSVAVDGSTLARQDLRFRVNGVLLSAQVQSVEVDRGIATIVASFDGMLYTVKISDGGAGSDIVELAWPGGSFGTRISSGNYSVVGTATFPAPSE